MCPSIVSSHLSNYGDYDESGEAEELGVTQTETTAMEEFWYYFTKKKWFMSY